jgi:hypothetical protein
MAWNPLHDGLLSSSILAEGPDVVAIWSLLVASSDRFGVSIITVPFAASVLRISDDRAEEAFRVLSSPDPKSRNKSEGGRRIIPTDEGGWRLVSHAKYRTLASKQAAAEAQQRYAYRLKAEASARETCEIPGCDSTVAGAIDGKRVCSAHAFSEEAEP